ncbi:peptidoglycan DD-metalloendopeptidase family protein [Glaciecola sp. MH2013]|uniref:peptidoglycan DD-metalloendopeptidase family protein n=1 Tax=Glaciecola sp. MH2013 TaxID=2785524 RepID=UPI00189E35A2|nr:peptidoglycan DD-metalloendopeptidase family protein [Glaciecola sp. MH2013]MBF7071847.1 peptidoglycan DD-metalloendopeptidase family protein [Glaciecola sp. MH2013]
MDKFYCASIRLFIFSLSLLVLLSCSGRHSPAPVLTLDTNITKKNTLTEITGETYTVQRGDTLFAVAFYSGNEYLDLARFNDLSAPYNIFPGQILKLTATPPKNNHNKNKGVKINPTKTSETKVDPSKTRAYGVVKQNNHRKKSKKETLTSIKPYNKPVWAWPAKGKSTSAVVGSDGTNRGADIRGELNSPIYAAADGKVVYSGNALKGYGNLIIVKHSNDLISAYAHNDRILVGEQTYVRQGDKIATMGRADNGEVMLHFEIRRKGKSLDPFKFLPRR